jgi:alginate O-acetyltransferase complex protein AlgI
MVFSSLIFLFWFLPIVLACHFTIRSLRWRNWFLLLASLFFYTWGEGGFVLVLLASITVNFLLALGLKKQQGTLWAKRFLTLAIVLNVSLLGAYKYANFLIDNLSYLFTLIGLPVLHLPPVHLPIGISFFTFHELSYLIDIYRGDAKVQKSWVNTALYVSFFPQLIAGPIIRYHEIASQLTNRKVTLERFAEGIRRFVIGLGKKMIIANAVAGPADKIFSIPNKDLTLLLSWFGVICYALQIYFDFSGYSDMAIGLAQLFGFHFPENFNYPYTSQSITEFWRRWHISLSKWFRDYLYIPLGGNRHSTLRTYFNLVTVFFLCGLWHGANWTFICWGLFHGCFLVLERIGFSNTLTTFWRPLRHAYALLVVTVGWVLFRSTTLEQAQAFLKAMVGLSATSSLEYHAGLYLTNEVKLLIIAGCFGSVPFLPWIQSILRRICTACSDTVGLVMELGISVIHVTALTLVMLASAMRIAAGTYSPFIYFRF